jgi:hypothetical protein
LTPLASALLYLLAVNAVACALLAWGGASAPALAAWAIALGVALALGERLAAPFSVIEAKRRDRVAVFLATIQLSVLVLALVLAAGNPTPRLLSFLAGVLSGYQILVLLLVRLTPHAQAVVGHSLALVALACLAGGPLAAWAAASSLGLVGLYVGVDHHARLLAAHRVDDGPHAPYALGRTAAIVLPVALLVGVTAYRFSPEVRPGPPPQVVDEGYHPLEEKQGRELDVAALRSLVVTGLAGAVAVYFVGRWIVRSKRGEKRAIETPEPLRGRLERIPQETGRSGRLPEYRGHRGRVVRAYLNLLRGAERAGFPRRPEETPDEFAVALAEPRAALEDATLGFVRARYGAYDVSAEDVARAEGSTDAVLAHLSRHPPRKRGRVVRDVSAETGRSSR